ncbi:MAG: hypothetical protein IKW71_01725 [Elusimicrobiaceae bacterium]|nr:hypothetical protein [Elusimicrobiaceae bacterium]
MKKLVLSSLVFTLLCAGCTSKEQDEQIKAFWQEQLLSILPGQVAMRPIGPVVNPPLEQVPPHEEMPPSEKETAPLQESAAAQEITQQPLPPAPAQESLRTTAATRPQRKIKAFLFTHTRSPVCQQLKADNWDTNFQQRYQNNVTLVEYDMINPASKEPLRALMRKHKMPSLTVPVLFIGDSVLVGYPFEGVDKAVELALKPAPVKKNAAPKRKQPVQYMEIIMEDSPQAQVQNAKASARDRRAIQLAFAGVQRNNQATLDDIGAMFGNDTQAQAFAIIARTERLLKKKASSSPNFQTYLTMQKNLLAMQEKDLNQLMRQHARNLRTIKG